MSATSPDKDNPTDITPEKADSSKDVKCVSIVSTSPAFSYSITKVIEELSDGSTRIIVTRTPLGPPSAKFPSDELLNRSLPKPHNAAITDGILLNCPTKKRPDNTPASKKVKNSRLFNRKHLNLTSWLRSQTTF